VLPVQFDRKMARNKKILSAASLSVLLLACAGGCAVQTTSTPPRSPSQTARAPSVKPLDPSQAERLQRIMIPLLRAGDRTGSLKEIRVGVVEDQNINAANAGGGEFYVTTGLLQKANDGQLRGILAHEIAHDDLGHVAKAQVLGTGLNLGVILLEQIIPGSSAITPIAGTLVARAYSRSEELEADRHAVEILQRAGYSKDVMIDALAWVMRSSPSDGGGFLSTHPATEDRIAALRQSH
jgi:beta-barrel assembly-enhancing protease